MADFKTHVQVGAGLGFVLSALAYAKSWVSGLLVAIMVFFVTVIGSFLPDTDSDSSVPVKIIFTVYGYFFAGVVFVFFYRMKYGIIWSFVGAGLMYLIVSEVLSRVFMKITRHRGIFHSLPALFLSFLISFYLFGRLGVRPEDNFVLSLGVFLGYFSHLILDEVYSLKFITDEEGRSRIGHKRSFGSSLDLGFNAREGKVAGIVAWLLVFILFLVIFPSLKQVIYRLFL